jgi:hypothetical protein
VPHRAAAAARSAQGPAPAPGSCRVAAALRARCVLRGGLGGSGSSDALHWART